MAGQESPDFDLKHAMLTGDIALNPDFMPFSWAIGDKFFPDDPAMGSYYADEFAGQGIQVAKTERSIVEGMTSTQLVGYLTSRATLQMVEDSAIGSGRAA